MARAWLPFVLVLLTVSACKGAAPLPPRAIDLNRDGVAALEAGDLETADARFELALEYNPRFVEALTNQGLVELQRGNFSRARQLLQRARRLNPDVAQPHHALGLLAEREGRADRASKHYQEALRIDPGFGASRANLARLAFDAGLYEHAREQFKKLSEVAPDEPVGYAGLAESLIKLQRSDEADAIISAARARFAEDPTLMVLDARRMLRAGDAREAIALLAPLTRETSDLGVAALAWTAAAELSLGHRDGAAKAARHALALAPDHAVARYVLSQTR